MLLFIFSNHLLVAMVDIMECMVCKHKFIRLGNYKRHLAKDHPEISETEVQLRGKQQQQQQQQLNNTLNSSIIQ